MAEYQHELGQATQAETSANPNHNGVHPQEPPNEPPRALRIQMPKTQKNLGPAEAPDHKLNGIIRFIAGPKPLDVVIERQTASGRSLKIKGTANDHYQEKPQG